FNTPSQNDGPRFSPVVTAHYAGDDSGIPELAAGILGAYAGISVEDFETQSGEFPTARRPPTPEARCVACASLPPAELLAYLRANGFANYIASGGGRDFMRPISQAVYGIPRERVIGS